MGKVDELLKMLCMIGIRSGHAITKDELQELRSRYDFNMSEIEEFVVLLGKIGLSSGRTLTNKDICNLRKRIEYEDKLLNSRTSIVLAYNALMAFAFQNPQCLTKYTKITVWVTIILINVFWYMCAQDSRKYIYTLGNVIGASNKASLDETIRRIVLFKPFRVGTTQFMTRYLPLFLILGWTAAMIFSARGM